MPGWQRQSEDCGCRVCNGYLEGQGNLESRLINPITHIVTLAIPLLNLAKSVVKGNN